MDLKMKFIMNLISNNGSGNEFDNESDNNEKLKLCFNSIIDLIVYGQK